MPVNRGLAAFEYLDVRGAGGARNSAQFCAIVAGRRANLRNSLHALAPARPLSARGRSLIFELLDEKGNVRSDVSPVGRTLSAWIGREVAAGGAVARTPTAAAAGAAGASPLA